MYTCGYRHDPVSTLAVLHPDIQERVMKILILMRHANPCPPAQGTGDKARSLDERGFMEARAAAQYLREQDLVPDAILSSTAIRTQQTAETMVDSGAFTAGVTFLPALYYPSVATICASVRQVPAEAHCLLLIAHNPALSDAIAHLTTETMFFPTAGLARLSCRMDSWTDIDATCPHALTASWSPGHE